MREFKDPDPKKRKCSNCIDYRSFQCPYIHDIGARPVPKVCEAHEYKIKEGCTVATDKEGLRIEFYQQDWMPGFAAFISGSLKTHGKAFCSVNIGNFILLAAQQEIEPSDLPYAIAESMMHEIVHCLESYFKVEFSENKVKALIQKYAEKYQEGELIDVKAI